MKEAGDVLQASVHDRQIIPLDFDSIDYAPQPDAPHLSISLESEEAQTCLPTIDLESPLAEESIVRACESWGMFIITNHGIPTDVLEGVEEEAMRFFSLPKEEKMKALRAHWKSFGYGVTRLAGVMDKAMWHEGFTISGSPVEYAKRVWPHDYMRFCETIEEYQKRMKALSKKILGLLLKNCGSLQSFDESGGFLTMLQLNSYPVCPYPDEILGLEPHTDASFISIIQQSNVLGLQLFHEQHGWISVSPKSGSLVVLVGDMLHLMSNARFHNARHRVTVSRVRHRLSFAFFYVGPAEFEVSPIVETDASGTHQEVRFRPVTLMEYWKMKDDDPNALSKLKITEEG